MYAHVNDKYCTKIEATQQFITMAFNLLATDEHISKKVVLRTIVHLFRLTSVNYVKIKDG